MGIAPSVRIPRDRRAVRASVTYSVSRSRLFTFARLPSSGSATPPRTAIQMGRRAATDSAGARMLRGRVCGGGGRDQVGRAGEGEIGRELGGAGDDAAGNGEEFDAGGGDQDVVGVTRTARETRARRAEVWHREATCGVDRGRFRRARRWRRVRARIERDRWRREGRESGRRRASRGLSARRGGGGSPCVMIAEEYAERRAPHFSFCPEGHPSSAGRATDS